jgi:hypothetical protein
VTDRTPLKSGVGVPDINQKVEHHTGYQINLRSGATGKKSFTSIKRTFEHFQNRSFLTDDLNIFY